MDIHDQAQFMSGPLSPVINHAPDTLQGWPLKALIDLQQIIDKSIMQKLVITNLWLGCVAWKGPLCPKSLSYQKKGGAFFCLFLFLHIVFF